MIQNEYDNMNVSVTELLRRQSKHKSAYNPTAHTAGSLSLTAQIVSILSRYETAFLFKSGLLRRLIYANLKLDWFYEFREYWVNELGMRKIEPHDFYFLHGVYRQKFQKLEVPDSADPDEFLRIWQQPATIYLLFAYQFKLALQPLAAYPFARYIPRNAKVCEYGCGLAPISQSLIKFYPSRRLNITVADIPLYMLHFLSWKYRHNPAVRILTINPSSEGSLTDIYDVITCMTVLEHLPRPLITMKHLHSCLSPRGIFIFDYIKSEGTGLDTAAGLSERAAVLDFIRQHFKVLKGSISEQGSISQPVICQRSSLSRAG